VAAGVKGSGPLLKRMSFGMLRPGCSA
jgi:hypothetical protein